MEKYKTHTCYIALKQSSEYYVYFIVFLRCVNSKSSRIILVPVIDFSRKLLYFNQWFIPFCISLRCAEVYSLYTATLCCLWIIYLSFLPLFWGLKTRQKIQQSDCLSTIVSSLSIFKFTYKESIRNEFKVTSKFLFFHSSIFQFLY